MATTELGNSEKKYRATYTQPDDLGYIALGHLFDAVKGNLLVDSVINNCLNKAEPITVLIEGSAFTQNMDSILSILSGRSNPEDEIILIDVSDEAIQEHNQHISQHFPGAKIAVVKGDMNNVTLPDGTIDLLINDCAINFNKDDSGNETTIKEIKRLLKKDGKSLALLTAVIDIDIDSRMFGTDDPVAELRQPGYFYPVDPTTRRNAWSDLYYQRLVAAHDFNYISFDRENGDNYFPVDKTRIKFRRYALLPRN